MDDNSFNEGSPAFGFDVGVACAGPSVVDEGLGTALPGAHPSEKYWAVTEDVRANEPSKTVRHFMVDVTKAEFVAVMDNVGYARLSARWTEIHLISLYGRGAC